MNFFTTLGKPADPLSLPQEKQPQIGRLSDGKPRMIKFSSEMHEHKIFQKSWTKTDESKLKGFTYTENLYSAATKQNKNVSSANDDSSYLSQAALEREQKEQPVEKDEEDLLITEKGLELEKKLSKETVNKEGTERRSSALNLINKDHIPFMNYFSIPSFAENLLKKQNATNILKNPSKVNEKGFHKKPKHAQFKGLCPYRHDQAFYMSPNKSTLLKGTFKGGQLVDECQLQIEHNKTVTIMKVIGGFYLAIGYFDGSFQLIDFKKEKAEILQVKRAGNGKEFVRDFFLYQKPNSSERFLVVLYVDQSDNERSYYMSQFYIRYMQVNRSSELVKLFSISNQDEKSSRFEHRREFIWLEKFRPLGPHCISFQLDETSVGILDLQKQSTAVATIFAMNPSKQSVCGFPLYHKGFHTGSVLNWTLLAPDQPSKFKHEDDLNLTLINTNGIFHVQIANDGNVLSEKIINPYDSDESLANEPWKPFDVLNLENKIIMIAGTMGLYKLKFSSPNKMTIELLESDNFYQLQLSYCERIITATGRSKNIELYEAPRNVFQKEDETNDLRKLCILPYDNVFYLMMTSEQIFFQFKPMKCWVVIDLQSSKIVRTQEARIRINNKNRYQKVLYDKVAGNNKDYSAGIISKETKFYPDDHYSRNIIGFQGSAVTAIDLNSSQDSQPAEINLMTKKEAENGFVVLSVNMHKSKLSWLVARNKVEQLTEINQDEIHVMVRQQEFGNSNPSKQVDIKHSDLEFALFSGFYLTMIRDNPYSDKNLRKPLIGYEGDCILTLCDSRDPDLHEFDIKEYFLIKFADSSMQTSGTDLSVQMPIKITKHLSVKKVKRASIVNDKNLGTLMQGLARASLVGEIEEKLEEQNIEVDSKACFILNDGTACGFTDYYGKHIFTKINKESLDQKDKIRKWNIGAQELKISPKGNRVVFEKENQCYVAKLNLAYKKTKSENKDALDTCETQELLNKWPLQFDGNIPGLARLKTVFWLSNDYFAVGDYIDEVQEPVAYNIFRSNNGRILCRFYLRNELEFLKCSTGPNLHFSNVTGILDRRSSKIYDTSLASLLHLGARRFNLRPKPLWQKQSQLIEKHEKIMVLNTLAPSLFFQNLLNLENHRQDLKKQKEIVTYRVMRSSLVETISAEKYKSIIENVSHVMLTKLNENEVLSAKIQNLFQYLCKQNEAELLNTFLVVESNYFSDGISPSPMSETTLVCSKVVNDWLQQIDQFRSREIYAGFEIKELISITKLPTAKVEQICENLTYNITKKLKYSSAILKNRAFALICDHDKLSNSDQQDQITKDLFKCNKSAVKDIIPKRGVPFNVYVSLMKFPLVAGSTESKNLLDNINQAGKVNNNIYMIKLIQKLLDFKSDQIIIPKVILISLHICYLFCCMALPYMHDITPLNEIEEQIKDDNGDQQLSPKENLWRERIMTIVFLIIFSIRELITMKALYIRRMQSKGKIKFHQSVTHYWSVWNFMDCLNIVSMICYLCTEKSGYYSIMVLMTWFNLLQYMRFISFFRFFIDLIVGVFTDSETWKFLIVLSVFLFGFSSSYLLLDLGADCRLNTENECQRFRQQFHDLTWTSFGDFGAAEDFENDSVDQEYIQWAIFGLAIFTMCIVMLNLLIGILSKAMERILDSKTQTEYSALCEIVYDLEVVISAPIFYCYNRRTEKKEDPKPKHLIFAEPIVEEIVQDQQVDIQKEDETKAEILDTKAKVEELTEKLGNEVKDTKAKVEALSDKLDQLIEISKQKGK